MQVLSIENVVELISYTETTNCMIRIVHWPASPSKGTFALFRYALTYELARELKGTRAVEKYNCSGTNCKHDVGLVRGDVHSNSSANAGISNEQQRAIAVVATQGLTGSRFPPRF